MTGRLGRPLAATAIFAAGAGVALGAKALLDRRKGGDGTDAGREQGGGDEAARQDLPTVLQRAALDVAVAATSQVAERLHAQAETDDSRGNTGGARSR